MRESTLRDITGREIMVGDWVRFEYNDGCSWEGQVTFEDGLFTVSILGARQVRNPDRWDRKHDWIRSRSWSCIVGYGEYGSWNCPRRAITSFAESFDSAEESAALYEAYGFQLKTRGNDNNRIDSRIIKAIIVS
jgi:hypothetical protein